MPFKSASPFVQTFQRTGDRREPCGSRIVSGWDVEIQFRSRMATFLFLSAAVSHLMSVKLMLYCTEFHQQFELPLCCMHLPDRPRKQSLFLHLESFRLHFPFGFLLCTLLGLVEVRFLLSRSGASFLTTIRSIVFPAVFCIARIWYLFGLLWSLPSLGIGLG